jgi:hypothetical protein
MNRRAGSDNLHPVPWGRTRHLVVPAAVAASLAVPAGAEGRPQGVDLARADGETLRVVGDRGDTAAYTIASAGDVNGDGVGDLVLGAPYADYNGRRDSGSVYVVFGRRPFDGVDLHFIDTRGGGYRVDGVARGERFGTAVAGGRDLDGDGFGDLVVGAPNATFFGRRESGAAYVLYGGPRNGALDLRIAPRDSFDLIGGRSPRDHTGRSVAQTADSTGDGVPDLLIGAPDADTRVPASPSANTRTGSAYLVAGRRQRRLGAPLDLANPAGGVRQFDGNMTSERVGVSVADAGDVDGDGLTDLLLGAPTADRNQRIDSGSAYTVRGSGATGVLNLSLLDVDSGVRVDGPSEGARLGAAVAGIGDMDGDRRADAVIGAPGAAVGTRFGAGRAYVTYGQTTRGTLDARALGTAGFAVLGASDGDAAGAAVSGAGDVNADGLADIVVGAYDADNNCRGASGSAYVVHGKFGRKPVYLSRLEPGRGYRIDGARAGDRLGWSVGNATGFAGPGPVVIAGSYSVNVPRPFAGAAYALRRGVRKSPSRRYSTRLPLRVLSRPGGKARDYEGYLSIPVAATSGTLTDVYAAAYTFGGRRIGSVSRRRLSGRTQIDIRLRERLRAQGYTVVITGQPDPNRFCGPKRREIVLRFR